MQFELIKKNICNLEIKWFDKQIFGTYIDRGKIKKNVRSVIFLNYNATVNFKNKYKEDMVIRGKNI